MCVIYSNQRLWSDSRDKLPTFLLLLHTNHQRVRGDNMHPPNNLQLATEYDTENMVVVFDLKWHFIA